MCQISPAMKCFGLDRKPVSIYTVIILSCTMFKTTVWISPFQIWLNNSNEYYYNAANSWSFLSSLYSSKILLSTFLSGHAEYTHHTAWHSCWCHTTVTTYHMFRWGVPLIEYHVNSVFVKCITRNYFESFLFLKIQFEHCSCNGSALLMAIASSYRCPTRLNYINIQAVQPVIFVIA